MNLGKDLNENKLLESYPEVLDILLYDNTTKNNIIWGTNNYKSHGIGYFENDHILVGQITGRHGSIIKPRVEKSKKEQQKRSKDMAEVFTPSWICNKQNNLVDEKWFGYENPFNIEQEKTWMPTPIITQKSKDEMMIDTEKIVYKNKTYQINQIKSCDYYLCKWYCIPVAFIYKQEQGGLFYIKFITGETIEVRIFYSDYKKINKIMNVNIR